MGIDGFYHELGRRVAARRKLIDVTQAEIGQRLGVSRASIANIEAGRQRLHVHQLYDLARALRLDSLADLLPLEIPVIDDSEPIGSRHVVSAVQRGQIDGLIRNVLAAVPRKPAGS